jgi:hypothetical protein
VTYNFDPDRWYELRLAALKDRRRRGELTDERFTHELTELDRRLEEMIRRLEGSYEIPSLPDEG